MTRSERSEMIAATMLDLRNGDELELSVLDIETARKQLGLPRWDRYDVLEAELFKD